MTSSENSRPPRRGARSSGSSVTVQWAVNEERPAGTVIGDLRQSLAEFVDGSALAATSFQTLPRPNQDLSALDIERSTGAVRATGVRLDREALCPGHNRSTDCTLYISVGLVQSLQLQQVYHPSCLSMT